LHLATGLTIVIPMHKSSTVLVNRILFCGQFFGILLTSIGFIGCASTPNPDSKDLPTWVNRPDQNYTDSRYLVAVGTGNSRNQAIADARKNLAESFLVKVQSETRSNDQSTLEQSTSGSVSGKSEQKISKDITLTTDTFLRGAEVKEVFEGPTTYALLALDKLKARSGLLLEAQKIQTQLDGLTEQLMQRYTQEKWDAAQSQIKKLDGLYSEAAALGMGGLVNINPYLTKLNQIEAAQRGKAKGLIFTLKTLKGEEYFQKDIEECLNLRGATVYTQSKAPNKSKRIELEIVERPQAMTIEGWTKLRFDLTASVTEEDGKLFRIQTSQTESGRSRTAVLESVSEVLAKDFCDRLMSRLGDFNQ
jgi:hypothetical protein